MNPYDSRDRRNLFDAIKYHYQALEHFRQNRTRLIEDYAGTLYRGKQASSKFRTYVNLMRQTAEAYMLSLAGSRPRYLVSARTGSLSGFARHFQTALNNLVKEIHIEDTFQACALDAFFGPAFAKVFLADSPLVQVEQDVWMDPGHPYVQRISMDDVCYDTDAMDFRRTTFILDRYRMSYSMLVKDDIRFDRQVASQILPNPRRNLDESSDQARGISMGFENDWGEFQRMVDLVDVYLPQDQIYVTWATRSHMELIDTDPLAVQEWSGSETGPYHLLNLGPVPDNIMPSSPASNLKHLFELANSLYRKLNNQARRQKDINIFEVGAEEDARKIRDVEDGGMLGVNDISGHGVIKKGGIDQQNLAFFLNVMDISDRMAGNLSTRAGLGAQAPTATQEQMIGMKVSRQESAMQKKMIKFAAEIGEDLAYLLFTDPVKTIPGTIRLEGTEFEYDSNWTPENRQGQFSDFDFTLEPYSMTYKSPQERAGLINQMVMGLIPMMPILQQQGIIFDVQKYLEIQSELLDSPRLLEIFHPGPTPPPAQGQNQATQSPVTTRENVRQNVSAGGTDSARRASMMQSLLAGGGGNNQMQGIV